MDAQPEPELAVASNVVSSPLGSDDGVGVGAPEDTGGPNPPPVIFGSPGADGPAWTLNWITIQFVGP
jgi:hypothetical protein